MIAPTISNSFDMHSERSVSEATVYHSVRPGLELEARVSMLEKFSGWIKAKNYR